MNDGWNELPGMNSQRSAYVVTPRGEHWQMAKNVEVVPLDRLIGVISEV